MNKDIWNGAYFLLLATLLLTGCNQNRKTPSKIDVVQLEEDSVNTDNGNDHVISTGEYQIDDKDSCEYNRLFIYKDHTARIIRKLYYVVFDDGEHAMDDKEDKDIIVWKGFSKKDGELYVMEHSVNSDGKDEYGIPYKKKRFTLTERIVTTEAFSWDCYVNDNIGTYIELKSSKTTVDDNDRYIYGDRMYYSYRAMLAKDEDRSAELRIVELWETLN